MPDLPTTLLFIVFVVIMICVVVLIRKLGQKNKPAVWTKTIEHQATAAHPTSGAVPVLDTSALESEYRMRMERVSAGFEKSLNETLRSLQSSMVQNMNLVQKSHGQFLSNLEEMASTEQKNSTQRVATKINELLINFEQNLTGFLSSSEQKSLEAINLEVRSARQLIDGYKAQQLAIVDENIVSVLEKTLEIVLKEKLTLKNQVDLVYDALERAKVEKFFV
jgi:hypothetical protein